MLMIPNRKAEASRTCDYCHEGRTTGPDTIYCDDCRTTWNRSDWRWVAGAVLFVGCLVGFILGTLA